MTRKDISILSFKVLGVYAFINAIDKLTDVSYYIFQNKNMHDRTATTALNFLIISGPILLLTFCGLLLWYTAPLLANSIFKSIAPEKKTDASLANIQTIAFSIIGLSILATGLPDLVNVILVILTSTSIEGGRSSMIHIIIVLLLKLFLGLWLFFGSRRIVNFLGYEKGDGN